MTRHVLITVGTLSMSIGRFVQGHDIARMAVYFASVAARLVSGQVIALDGPTVSPDPKL